MKILQICPRVPYPPTDGGSIAMFQVFEGLHESGHELTGFCLNTPKHYCDPVKLNDIGNFITADIDTNLTYAGALNGLFQSLPYILSRFHSREAEQQLIRLVKDQTFDIIQFEGTFVAPYLPAVQLHTNATTVLRLHNLEHRIWENLASRENFLKKWYFLNTAQKLRRFETRMFPRFDKIITLSRIESDILDQLNIPNHVVIEPGFESSALRWSPETNPASFFIFGSMNWRPNIEGVDWFLKHVWPPFIKQHPKAHLHIGGVGMSETFKVRSIPNATIHGFVENPEEFRANHGVMLVPLLSGGGIRVKVLEAMAQGVPIVTTTKGAESISLNHGTDAFISDQPEAWIDHMAALIEHEGLAETIGRSAHAVFEKHYEKHRTMEAFENTYHNLIRTDE